MAASGAATIGFDARGELRDPVYHRTSATRADGPALSLLIVNISPSGLMARSIDAPEPGTLLSFTLPVIGQIGAEVRWSLGGRLGCQLARTIPPPLYYEMLAGLSR
ncbi:PilZ domain-containing protein [uncultured Sphingomonas sp.]|uniref:PilZ domain-containing protein n=1 Tax=uncultured Sphingomonas sp. TaxID=158754 RepID=UPI0026184B13|nr:PilZ domain-containing protein [uncultured Sphingomonas sp.]